MKRFTISTYVDKRKGRVYPYAVYLAINRDGGRFYVVTDVVCQTDVKDLSFDRKEPSRAQKNLSLAEIYSKVESVCMSHDCSNKELKEHIDVDLGRKSLRKSLVRYINDFKIATKTNRNTITEYDLTIKKVESYDKNATLESVDCKWLQGFEKRMRECGLSTNGLAKHLRDIRAVFNWCVDNGYTNNYPFRKFKIKHEETRKRALTSEQMRLIADYPCEEWMVRYRDMFILSFLMMGINVGDLSLLKKSYLVGNRLQYKRQKTSKLYDILVPPMAMEIIDRYKGSGEYLLAIMEWYKDYHDFTSHCNRALKKIGTTARKGCRRVGTPLYADISTYWARYSFASIAANECGISRETIGACLGHSWTEVTDIYIDFDKKRIDEAQKRVIDCVFGSQ